MKRQKKDAAVCRVTVRAGSAPKNDYDGLMVPLYEGEGVPARCFPGGDLTGKPKRRIEELIAKGEIRASFKEFTILHTVVGKELRRVIVMGMGKRTDDDLDHFRSVCARAARLLRRIGIPRMTVQLESIDHLPVEQLAEGAAEAVLMGLYKFPKFSKDTPKIRPFEELALLAMSKTAVAEAGRGARRGEVVGHAVVRTRTLINLPANHCTADTLETEGFEVAGSDRRITMKVYDVAALKKMSMGGILAVGQGSATEPRLLELNFRGNPKSPSTLALVGKGVTYDSGGLSLKPDGGHIRLKNDMSGAAIVLGVLRVAAALDWPVNLLVLMPLAENMPDGKAYRPSDVIRMANGMHVEIGNTDAEGRLVLADALVHAAVKKADAIIDIATLTGSVVSALGHICTGLLGTNQNLVERIIGSGKHCAERHWQLPLFPEHITSLRSTVADLQNLGCGPGQTSVAATFLKQFVPEEIPWAHLDIVGTAWIGDDPSQYLNKPYHAKRGATAIDLRTLAHLTEGLAREAQERKLTLRELLAPAAKPAATAAAKKDKKRR